MSTAAVHQREIALPCNSYDKCGLRLDFQRALKRGRVIINSQDEHVQQAEGTSMCVGVSNTVSMLEGEASLRLLTDLWRRFSKCLAKASA